MHVRCYTVGPMQNNTYLVVDEASGEAAVVDPSFDSRFILDDVRRTGWMLKYVLNTHAHFDHVIENAYFVRQGGGTLALHPDDVPLLDAVAEQASWFGMPVPERAEPGQLLTDGGEVMLGQSALRVILAPGHSPGSVCFLGEGWIIVGDVLFSGSVGRTDLPGGDHATLLRSLRDRLLTLPDETEVYPGHGEPTTIGEERKTNPYLRELR